MCHIYKHSNLPCVAAFATEVWTRDNIDSAPSIDVCIVRNELSIDDQLLERMPTIGDADFFLGRVDDIGPDKVEICCTTCKRQDAVQIRESPERCSQVSLAIEDVIFELANDHAFGVFDERIQIAKLFVKLCHVDVLEEGIILLNKDAVEILW